jgi:8-oxo-dGTP diphosphatase
MEDFFRFDPLSAGVKGLVYIGDDILVYRRDTKTNLFPLYIDVPGGGPKDGETPFDTFRREVKEEFGLDVVPEDIVYVRCYDGVFEIGKHSYFPVAKLPREAKNQIKFGDEGTEYMIMPIEKYLSLGDDWPYYRKHTLDYFKSLS